MSDMRKFDLHQKSQTLCITGTSSIYALSVFTTDGKLGGAGKEQVRGIDGLAFMIYRSFYLLLHSQSGIM